MFADLMGKVLKEVLDLRKGIRVVDFSKIHGNTLVKRISTGQVGMFTRCFEETLGGYKGKVPVPVVHFENMSWPTKVDPADLILFRTELQLQAPMTIIARDLGDEEI
jgi:hypothetical protein